MICLTKIESGLVVVDELSMLDERTAYQLFSNISSECKVVLCGDDEQLPSVSAGAVLRDIVDANTVPSVTLNQVYRQAKGSSIYENSFKIRNNDLNLILGKDFYILEEPDVSKIEDELINLYLKKVSEYGIEEVMLLVPFKEHEGGVIPLNQKIQERLHPEHLQEREFHLGMKRFRLGDRVMQLKNSDEQVNGECGTVIDIGKSDGEQTVTVKFDRSERTSTDDKADEITSVEAAADLSFAVESGSAGEAAAEENGFNYVAVKTQADAVMEVSAGTSDACIIDLLMAGAMVGEGTSYDNLTHTVELTTEEYGIGCRKDSDLAAYINDELKALYDAGTMEEIANKYGVQDAIVTL